jgi:hypothetical protein
MAGTKKIRNLRRAALAVVGATTIAIVGIAAGPVRAAIAPSAASKATAVAARPLDTAVGVSQASAGEDGASSEGVGVRALGRDIAVTRADGGQTRSDSAASARVPLTQARVEVLPRRAEAHEDENASRSAARTDLVTARIPNLASVEVLSTEAEAVWTPRASSSGSQVDGATVELLDGDLVVVLMHAEGSSDGRGRLYLVRINDATFVDSARSDRMTLAVPNVFSIELAAVNARAGRYTGQVLKATWLDTEGLDQLAAAVDASGGTATETHALRASSADVSSDGGSPVDGDARLPLSGAPILTLVLAALTLLEVGAAMTLVRTGARVRA